MKLTVMKTIIKKSVVLTAIIGATATFSNAQMTLTGELRPRAEYRHGYKSPADTLQKAAMFISQRTRLNFGFKTEKFKIGMTLQDVRIWGSQAQLNAYDVNTFSLHEGWAEYLFSNKISMKLGRQELAYDDERILGAVNWNQQGRSHDAFLLKYADTTFSVHAGFAYNQNGEISVGTSYVIQGSYKEMQYLWINKQIKSLNFSLLTLNVGQQSPLSINSTRYTTTFGTHTEYKTKPFLAGLSFYYQTGVDKNKKEVAAVLGGIDLAYILKKKFTIGLGFEYQSGQSSTDTTKEYRDINHSFNPVFGTNHKFNGYMDYFYVGNHVDNVGLQDVYLKLKYNTEKWNVALDLHEFMTAADVVDSKELAKTGKYKALSSALGTEIDLTYAHTISTGVTLTAGYSHFLPTKTLGVIKGIKNSQGDGRTDQVSNWAYIMIAFKPNFLKQ